MQGIFAGLTGAAKVSGAGSSEPSSQTVRSSKAPVRFILGRASTGGVLAWIQEQPGDQTSGEWLHIVYVLSEGAIAGVDQIYVDERPLSELGENATSEVIIDPAQVNAFLLANCPDWRQEQIGRGLSFVRLSFKYDAEKFPSGIPDVRFVVRGRRDIYDPRNGSSGYSANTALLILWYLRNRCGIPDDEIIFQSFASAANVSDEAVGGPDGTVTPRYFAGAVIGADEKRNTVLDNLLSACAGTLIRVGGRWSLQVGAYYGPADFTINEDMVIGTVEGTTEVSNSDAINTMRGTFVDPAQAWAETDYPEVAIQDWITADGGELAESQSFAYVTDAYLAQRLANISLRRRRSGGSVSMPLNFNGYNCRPGRAVKVDLPSLNILGEFMVTEWTMGAADACKVTLKPYEQAIFDDAVGQPYDPLGFINLPVGGLAAVTGLAWTPSSVAEIIQGVLSWVPPTQTVLSYTVTIRKGTEVVQSLKVGGEAASCNVNGLASGTYTMSVVAFGPGTRSGEASINVNVGGPPVPESCDYFASVDSITLVPVNRQNSLNGGTYEYFHATNPQTPIADAVYLGQGLTFTHTGLAFAKQYFYYVRSANAYGKSDFLYVAAATSDDPTQMLEVIKGEILESHLGQQLTEKIDLIDGNGPGSVNERVESARSELSEQVSEVNNAVVAVNNSLAVTKGNLEQQITAVNQSVSDAKTDLQQQINTVSALAGSLPYNKDKAYTTNQGVLGADGKLYQALKAVPKNTPPPNATYWTDVGQAIVTAAGTASRVSKVETDVSTLDGKTTAQATQIGGLQSGLTATNQNVTAAQQAADAANTLAGGKGKVIIKSAAPAVADRLAQNLWIDTTGNANTPKRWNGTTWVAVTDKAATDAAAAAQSALAQVALKADATVVNNVTTRVSEAEGKLSSQASRMDGMQTSIDGKASSQSLQQVSNRVTDTEQKDAAQDQQLTSQSQALTALTDSVSKKAEAATVQALSNEVKTQGQNQAAQGQALTRIDTKLLASQDNSPTKVYQSVFSDMAQDQWVPTNAGSGASASFGTPAGITRGTALILDGGSGNRTWWGASTRKIRFDPSRLYKLTARVQQLSISGGAPLTYLGLDCFAEDGVTRVTTAGGTGVGSAHYVLMNSRQLSAGEWVTVEAYVKGYSATGEDGGSGAGTVTDPKRLKTGVAWFSPLVIAGYNGMGGRLVVDLFDIEDATEQAQIDAGAMATTALTGRVEKNEQGLTSVSSQTTQLSNSLTTTSQKVDTAQKAAQDAASLAGSKGKVLVQSSAPAASDRQEQNLWIDTTGNANTPKRWSGSAWLAVTDKVATEAAAAAASALAEVAKKADASALQTLGSKVDQQGKDLTATSSNLVSLGSVIGRALDNSPTKVYQSVFSDLSADQWVSTNSGTGAAASFGAPSGITRGAALILNGGSANKTWWGASTRKIRFDPSRLYKLTVRVQQVLMGAGEPGTYAGVDCFAEDGVTRVATHGGNSVGSSHYVLMTNRKLSAREWVTAEVYVKGFTASGEGGESGAGTVADPKRLKEGTAWFSPMVVAGYNDAGGQLVVDFFDIEDATEQAQVDANAAATSALTAKVSQNEQGLNSASRQLTELSNSVGTVAAQQAATSQAVDSLSSDVSQQAGILSGVSARTTTLENSLTTTGQNVTAAQQAADAANTLAGGKGKVIIQAAAPAPADRLAQNLWIDTTNNANTPKRWSGSAWVAVTDKAATDAAAAAQSALTQVATKAEASALQALTNRVDAVEGMNTSQSTSLIDLSNNVGAIQSGLGASGLDPAPGAYWQFDAGADGMVGVNANTAVSGGSLRLTPTSTNPQLLTSSGALTLSIPGAQYTKVRVGLTRRGGAATSWTGTLYYSTTTHGILSAYRASAANPNIAVGQSAVVEWDMANLAVGGTDWVESTIGRLRFDFANALDAVWDVDWIAVGRVGPSASSRVVESLTSTVTQQGDKLTAEAQRIDGLYTSVGNAQAAIQNEITARTNADSALSQQLQTTQATLGDTTASVQRVSTTLNQLNGVANASEVVKVQITANGIRHVAGFGLSIDNSKGAVQSTFAILAGRFAILNPTGDAVSSPFAVVGNQTFISDAYIRDASIGNAKITNGAITTAKIGEAEVDTLRIRGNAVTIPVGAFAGSSTVSVTVTLDGNYPVFLLGSLTQTYQSDISMTRNGVLLWTERPQNSTLASRGVMDYPGPGTHTYTLSSNHAGNTNGASILAVVCKR
ncbi:MAG: phage tail tip fiber protein [Pseudomonas putida]